MRRQTAPAHRTAKKEGEMINVLNLYAGLGGNRKLWKDCRVTAVELNPKIAAVYGRIYPKDELIVTDAHQYLLDHYQNLIFWRR